MKKGWSGGKIAAAVIGAFFAVIILGVAFVASVFHLSLVLEKVIDSYEEALYEWDEEPFEKDEKSGKDVIKKERKSSKADSEEKFEYYEEEYYQFGNAVTEGLSYEVTFEEYVRDDFAEAENGLLKMECEYPVVSGEVPNLEGINNAIYSEISLIEEHVEDIAGYLEGSRYEYYVTAYVTYMSDEILSIAYEEYVFLDDDYFEKKYSYGFVEQEDYEYKIQSDE